MRDRPIIMSAPMVRALLRGRKTQTRRIVKPQPWIDRLGNVCSEHRGHREVLYGQHPDGSPNWQNFAYMRCPYGRPGDRLWVRETWALACELDDNGNQETERRTYYGAYYGADGEPLTWPGSKWREKVLWKPSIHMPRWASRLTLTITDARVERLQEIREAEAIAEGIEGDGLGWRCYAQDPKGQTHWACPLESYRTLWDSINGKGSWSSNPWVWAISFDVERRNIDALPARDAAE